MPWSVSVCFLYTKPQNCGAIVVTIITKVTIHFVVFLFLFVSLLVCLFVCLFVFQCYIYSTIDNRDIAIYASMMLVHCHHPFPVQCLSLSIVEMEPEPRGEYACYLKWDIYGSENTSRICSDHIPWYEPPSLDPPPASNNKKKVPEREREREKKVFGSCFWALATGWKAWLCFSYCIVAILQDYEFYLW